MFDDEDLPREDYRESEIFKKAEEIRNLVERIISVDVEDGTAEAEFEKSWFKSNQEYLRNNSHIICAKIAGAYGDMLYDIKMENAAIIRKAARELITDARGIQMHGFKFSEFCSFFLNIFYNLQEIIRSHYIHFCRSSRNNHIITMNNSCNNISIFFTVINLRW